MQEVLSRTNGKVRLWPATLYGTLERLLDEGLIAEASRRPPAGEDDARRRYYRLTAQGRRVPAGESMRRDCTLEKWPCEISPNRWTDGSLHPQPSKNVFPDVFSIQRAEFSTLTILGRGAGKSGFFTGSRCLGSVCR